MSYERIEAFLRSTGFRLTAWYLVVFVLSLGSVAAVAEYFVVRSVESKEQGLVTGRLEEYRAEFETGGISGLANAVSANESPGTDFVRLSKGQLTVYEHKARPDLDGPPSPRGVASDAPNPQSNTDKRRWRVAVTEVSGNLQLQVGRSNAQERELLGHVRNASLEALGSALLVGLVGGAIFTRRALSPVRRLSEATRSIIRSGRLDARVPTRGSGDDLDELTELFNRMLERNEGLVDGMREALDNVAHDLRTPLTRLRACAELALRGPQDAGVLREALAESVEESDRVLSMLRALMDISAAESGVMRLERQPVQLEVLARQVVDTYEMVAEERGVKLLSKLQPARVVGDETRLRQLIANLVDNALKYTPTGGLVELGTRQVDRSGEISVRDTGMGISEEDQPRIFERLYRGDRSRSEPGLGLGLSFVKAICDAHRGRIRVVSSVGHGTQVTVTLPESPTGEL